MTDTLWTVTVDYNSGDGPDDLYINPLSRTACEMKGAIIATKNVLNNLEDQFEEVKKLLKGEKDDVKNTSEQ